jgi:hypothetical protein
MLYTVTIRDENRNRTSWKVFTHYHEAQTWLLLKGFFNSFNYLTHETAELKRRNIGV